MNYLEANINYLKEAKSEVLKGFPDSVFQKGVSGLTIDNVQLIADRLAIPLENLLLYPLFAPKEKLKKIKLLILDVDGVLTDAGMFFSESGDQMKKYNAKDGMAIMALRKKGFDIGIISSGFKTEMVKSRADLLRINLFYVGREPKIDILDAWLKDLGYSYSEVAIIGDDINDLPLMREVGLSVCPQDAVDLVKKQADIVLSRKGGDACVREFIDNFLLSTPVSN